MKRVKLHNIKEDTLTSCNAKVDGSQYLNSGWNLSKEFPQEYREKIFECVEEEKHKQALNLNHPRSVAFAVFGVVQI